MKKIIRLITLLLCVCLASACFSGCGKDLEGKIEISGDKITLEEANSFVEQRKIDYPQDEEGLPKEEWFNIEISYKLYAKLPNELVDSSMENPERITEIKLIGKVGFIDENNMALDLQINADIESIDPSNNEAFSLNGRLILVDEVYYIDLVKTKAEDGGEKDENIKKMGKKDILDEFEGLQDAMLIIEDYVNCEYNPDTFKAISVSENGEIYTDDTNSIFTFYKAEDKIFAEQKTNFFFLGSGFKDIIQYEFEFEKDSSLIKTKRVYTRNYMKVNFKVESLTINTLFDFEVYIQMQRIDPIVIVAPDLEGYEQA